MNRATDDVRLEQWEERAAILEFEGDLPRQEAERQAAQQCFGVDELPAPLRAILEAKRSKKARS